MADNPKSIADIWYEYISTCPDEVTEELKSNLKQIFYDGVLAGLWLWRDSKGDAGYREKLAAEYLNYFKNVASLEEKECAND